MAVQVLTVEEFTLQSREYGEKEFDADEVGAWHDQVVGLLTRAIGRGDGVAVYVNEDLGHPNIGQWQIMSYGGPDAQLETREDWGEGDLRRNNDYFVHGQDVLRRTLPDIGGRINWRYQLHSIVPPELSVINLTETVGEDPEITDPATGHLVLVQVRVSPRASAEEAVKLVQAAVENGIDVWRSSGGESGFESDDTLGTDSLSRGVTIDILDVEVCD